MKLVRVGLACLALVLTASVAFAQAAPPRMGHLAAGHAQCMTCHGANANPNVVDVPASHSAFQVTQCSMCHQPPQPPPPVVPHGTTEAFAQCRTCHVANSPMGAPALPASHARRNVAICTMCHTPRRS